MSTEIIHTSSHNSTPDGALTIATTRQAQEVQAAMVIAKKFPRDETEAIGRVLRACRRRALAEVSQYAYPRGGNKITGPSIRLAEAIAQAWGNIDYGVIELEQTAGESTVMAYAWDLETNTRRQMVFNVPHVRGTKNGNVLLSDPRDIYEMVANQGARRVRACILGVIPGDVQDLAIAECEKTLTSGNDKPLADRVRDMVLAFNELGVSKAMIEARLQHPVEACVEQDFLSLKKIYLSIRDGISSREDWFDLNAGSKSASDGDAEKTPPRSRTQAAAEKAKAAKTDAPGESQAPPADRPKTAAKQQTLGVDYDALEQEVLDVQTKGEVKTLRRKVEHMDLTDQQRIHLVDLLDKAWAQFEFEESHGRGN